MARTAGARVLRHPHNVGYGRSLKDGIGAATYDMIAISDADGSYPLEAIPDLVVGYRDGFDMVVGARTGAAYPADRRSSSPRLPRPPSARDRANRPRCARSRANGTTNA